MGAWLYLGDGGVGAAKIDMVLYYNDFLPFWSCKVAMIWFQILLLCLNEKQIKIKISRFSLC